MRSRAERKTSRAYVRRVRGGTHQARVVTKTPAPITSTMTLSGRRAAARLIRPRSAGERGEGPGSMGPGSGRSGSIASSAFSLGSHMDRSARLEPERVGGVALVYGQAQPPVRVGDEHQLSRLGRPEGLQVADRHLAVPDVHAQGSAVLEPRLLLGNGQPGVAIVVYGDDPGRHAFADAPVLDAGQA